MKSKVFDDLSFYSTDLKKGVKIRRNSKETIAALEPVTVPQFVEKVVKQFSNHPALKHKDPETDEWETTTYAEYKMRIEKVAKSFIKLGLERHGVVAILAFNSVEWYISEMAAIHAGGISTGIYTTNSAQAVQFILENSKAQIIVVDEQEQFDKILQIQHNLPQLKAIIQTMNTFSYNLSHLDGVWRWRELELMDTRDIDEEYQNRLKLIAPNECCTIVYTSGTTGNPKGVMMSHDNVIMSAEILADHFISNGLFKWGKEVSISFLPLSHIAAKISEIYMGLRVGGTLCFADKDALKGSLIKTLREIRPTTFFAVPRVYEKIQEKLMEVGSKSGTLKRSLAKWAKSTSLKYHTSSVEGNSSSSFQYKLASTIVLSKVKKAIGFDRVRTLVAGGAPMNAETKNYFLSLDLPIADTYGLSESTGCFTMAKIHDPYVDSVGRVSRGLSVKISNPDQNGHGEICYTGRTVFMGYLGELEKTLEVFDEDGWLKTGDLGYIKDGFIFITGRIKEIIITAGGENIPPVHVENLVKAECPAISNAFLVGDKKKFLTMLIALKTEMDKDGNPLDELASESLMLMESLSLKYTKLSEVLAGPDPTVTKAIEDAISRANKNSISNAQKVQKFTFLPHDFSIHTGELGPTLKVKRHFVTQKYKNLIEKLYQ